MRLILEVEASVDVDSLSATALQPLLAEWYTEGRTGFPSDEWLAEELMLQRLADVQGVEEVTVHLTHKEE